MEPCPLRLCRSRSGLAYPFPSPMWWFAAHVFDTRSTRMMFVIILTLAVPGRDLRAWEKHVQ